LIWFVRDFDLLALLLRALSFSLEALTLGAIFFLLVAARPSGLAADAQSHLRRIASRFALALVVIQFALIATTSAELMSSAGLPFRELLSASYFLSGGIFAAASFALFLLLRFTARLIPSTACAAIALAASVSLSHAASRMDHRALLFAATALHHLGMAAWLGALPFLLIAIRLTTDGEVSLSLSRRFSTMALTSVCVLVLAGALLAWDYTGSWQGLYGSSYGILLSAKIILTALILVFGAANFTALRNVVGPYLFNLRRFSEVELILGFTVVLAAASLTAQSPPVDQMPQDMLSGRAVLARMTPRWPSFRTPDLAQLTPPTPLSVAVREATFTGGSASDFNDRAWSEYNHHWAGLIVLVVGLLAMVARLPHQRWAQHWPLLFLALAAFILLRADPECWPLGPRPFWRSFTAPDVLEHRLFALLIVLFALFEWSVRTGRLSWTPARYVFPVICAAGGALLLTHTHSLGDGTDEVFAELSHTPIAILAALAGAARWLELRLEVQPNTPDPANPDPAPRQARRITACIWPLCFLLIGLLLLNYRES
jgi:putative copper resistance protein D